ncbi:hypothetical protein [Methanoregula sp.]|uniref:hypothetical protein n=1 Tax=Methanoregula sp. TaxID=2052170 RepID=UPI002D04198B|nr:hypothetical protein [Methanoregula sp.]HVP95554.1 hypothetical protein [Methanoregula sp.]
MHNSQDPVMQQKREVLARFLGVDTSELRISNGHLYGFRAFFHGNDAAYLVLADAEATRAAENAVQEKLWLISLESLFAFFDIDATPPDLLGKIKTKEIRQANEEIKKLIHHTCGMEPLKKRMLTYGNRKNLLADYDQTEHYLDGYFIYRLY